MSAANGIFRADYFGLDCFQPNAHKRQEAVEISSGSLKMADQILVIKHGAFGDVVQGFDAFASLRISFPEAKITVLTTAPYAGLLRASGWFDEVVLDARAPAWKLTEVWKMRSFFRQKWDKIIDLQCSRRTARYTQLCRSGTRWFGTAPGVSDPMPDFTGVNNRDRMLTAARLAGAEEHEDDLSFLRSAGLPAFIDAPDYVLLLPGSSASKPSKRWPTERFIQLAEAIAKRGLQPVLGGSEIDRPVTEAIAKACPSSVNLTGQTDLFSLAGLAARARCVIGNDTGPVFLAARLHVPTLMLMGADTDPAMSAPYGKHARWMKQDRLDDLSLDKVWGEVLPWLKG